MHWIYPAPSGAAEPSKSKCWTCGFVKPDTDVEACTRPHCDARNVLNRAALAEQRSGTRPPKAVDMTDPHAANGRIWATVPGPATPTATPSGGWSFTMDEDGNFTVSHDEHGA